MITVGGAYWKEGETEEYVKDGIKDGTIVVANSTETGMSETIALIDRNPTKRLRRVRVPYARDSLGTYHFFRDDAPDDAEPLGYTALFSEVSGEALTITPTNQ